ncbi:hypothetical protein QS458_23405 [Escherichia coli]|nr:hypothetical protein [Escherichia coli]
MSELSYLEKLLDGVEVEWKTLEDISIKISSGGTPKTGVSEFYDGDIPWLRTQEVNFCDIWDMKWFTEFGHLNRGDMLTSEQHRCHNEKKKFQRRV